jgi:hypothetical protein
MGIDGVVAILLSPTKNQIERKEERKREREEKRRSGRRE